MRKYKIKVQKTIQEKQFEPFVVALETSFDIPKELSEKAIDDLVLDEYEELEHKVDDIIEDRLDRRNN